MSHKTSRPSRLSPPEVVNAHGTSYIRLDIVKAVLAERESVCRPDCWDVCHGECRPQEHVGECYAQGAPCDCPGGAA